MESIPPGGSRDQALARIRRLDCANPDPTLAACDPSLPPPAQAATWRAALEDARIEGSAYGTALAAALKTLLCARSDVALYILRRVDSKLVYIAQDDVDAESPHSFPISRLAATGPEAPALLDFIMSKDCPVSVSLTDVDKADLLRIKQAGVRR